MRISDWSSDVCSSDIPARGRLPLAAAAAAGLDGLRHGRAAAARGRTHDHLAARRLVPAGDLQPQAADEETLGRNPAVPGPGLGTGRAAARDPCPTAVPRPRGRSEEHTSELQSLMRISYAVFCLQKKKDNT